MKSIRKPLAVLVAVLVLSLLPLTAFASSGGGTARNARTARQTVTPSVDASPVPEPGALLLFAAGAVVVGAAIRTKRR